MVGPAAPVKTWNQDREMCLPESSDSINQSALEVDMINAAVIHHEGRRIYATLDCLLQQGVQKLDCKIDTGSDGNLLPLREFHHLFPHVTPAQLKATRQDVPLMAYAGGEIRHPE